MLGEFGDDPSRYSEAKARKDNAGPSHHRRLRHVNADLDHRGSDKEARLTRGETFHGAILFGASHLAMHEADQRSEALPQ